MPPKQACLNSGTSHSLGSSFIPSSLRAEFNIPLIMIAPNALSLLVSVPRLSNPISDGSILFSRIKFKLALAAIV